MEEPSSPADDGSMNEAEEDPDDDIGEFQALDCPINHDASPIEEQDNPSSEVNERRQLESMCDESVENPAPVQHSQQEEVVVLILETTCEISYSWRKCLLEETVCLLVEETVIIGLERKTVYRLVYMELLQQEIEDLVSLWTVLMKQSFTLIW